MLEGNANCGWKIEFVGSSKVRPTKWTEFTFIFHLIFHSRICRSRKFLLFHNCFTYMCSFFRYLHEQVDDTELKFLFLDLSNDPRITYIG